MQKHMEEVSTTDGLLRVNDKVVIVPVGRRRFWLVCGDLLSGRMLLSVVGTDGGKGQMSDKCECGFYFSMYRNFTIMLEKFK